MAQPEVVRPQKSEEAEPKSTSSNQESTFGPWQIKVTEAPDTALLDKLTEYGIRSNYGQSFQQTKSSHGKFLGTDSDEYSYDEEDVDYGDYGTE